MIYDASYGDARLCKCGHPYYRHFDTYDNMKKCWLQVLWVRKI